MESSELRRQVRAYRAAVAWAHKDDERLVTGLRNFIARWPASPLRQEAELEVIAALARLGKTHEGRNAARRFVLEHPDNAKARDLEPMLKQDGEP